MEVKRPAALTVCYSHFFLCVHAQRFASIKNSFLLAIFNSALGSQSAHEHVSIITSA